jgi:hypothetical protein
MTKEEMKNILRVYLEAFENYQITNTGNLDATGHIAELARAAVKEDEKEWVGLTDEERIQLAIDCGAMSADWVIFLEAVEAKLRDKNS